LEYLCSCGRDRALYQGEIWSVGNAAEDVP